MSATRIASTFESIQSQGRMAFMPFITAGDPDLRCTADLIELLGSRGADFVEVGFPYSDPIADGPVIQASYTRALERKFHVADLFQTIAGLPTEKLPPLVGMVSYAIIYRTGPEIFLQQCSDSGFAGLIVPDLPAEEAGEFGELVRGRGLDLIQLIAPTTTHERAERIIASASGFLYCISVAGTTGVRDQLPPELNEQLAWLRTRTALPLAVGFGISRPEQVDGLRGKADGVIVGSGIVRMLERISTENASRDVILGQVGEFASSMAEAVRASS